MLKSTAAFVFAQAAPGGDIISTMGDKAKAALGLCIVIAVMFAGATIVLGAKKQRTAETVSHGVRVLIGCAVFACAAAALIVGKKIAEAAGLI